MSSIVLADVYITTDNMYADWFTDGVERCYLVLFNGTRMCFTSYDSDRIDAELDSMTTALENMGYTWKDVMLVIHNHFSLPRFSDADNRTYWRINAKGFHGAFSIYLTSSGKVITMQKEKRND